MYPESFSQNLTTDIDWITFNSPHLLPAVNWALANQNVQKENIEIDPDLLRLKSHTQPRRCGSSTSTLIMSPSEDFNFEIE